MDEAVEQAAAVEMPGMMGEAAAAVRSGLVGCEMARSAKGVCSPLACRRRSLKIQAVRHSRAESRWT